MRTLTVIVVVIVSASAGPISLPEDEFSGISNLISENSTLDLPYGAKEEDVKFYFASRQHPNLIRVEARDPRTIAETSFSPTKDTWFLVHGWKNDFSSNMEETVGRAIMEREDVNIFCVDWSNIAKKTYIEALAAVPDIGRITGELIKVLIKNHGMEIEKMFLVGHSLGAHVAGRIGANLEGKVSLIVGLDPAGPGFFTEITANRLDSTDAKFVHVIHTCGSLLGFKKPIGHADYYPNGGGLQPGCPVDITGSCSHARSYFIFAESVMTGGFLARSCQSQSDFDKGKCHGNHESEMGTYSPDRWASGTYYLTTNPAPPYARR